MPYALLDIFHALPAYALVLFRLTGLMWTAPVFGSAAIPLRIRAALAMTLAAMVFPVIAPTLPQNVTVNSVITGAVTELMIGALIGLVMTIVLMAAEFGGVIIGQQAGLALGEVFDPSQNRQTTIMGQVYTIVFLFLFLAVGGHREMLLALLDTFRAVPVFTFQLDASALNLLLETIAAAFVVGIRIAGPVLIALFLMGVALGFLSRTMPQFNILTVGFTLRVLVAVAICGLALSATRDLLIHSVWDALDAIKAMFGLNVPAGGSP